MRDDRLRKESGMETRTPDEVPVVQEAREEDLELLPELVTHLRDRRTELREQWANRITPRGVETYEVVGIVLLLRDVLARSLFEKYQKDVELLNRVLDAYEPAANRIANTVAV